MAIKRSLQLTSWIVLGALVGLFQEVGTILLVFPKTGAPSNRSEEFGIFAVIAILYGMGWLSTALLLSDFLFLRRGLEPREFKQYLGIVASCAVVLGLVLPGFGLMVGFPLTAIAILCAGFAFKKPPHKASGVLP